MKLISFNDFIYSIIIGIITGVIGPYTGAGGTLILPLLLYFKVVPSQKCAIGTYFASAPSIFNIFSIYNFWEDGYVYLQIALIIGFIYGIISYIISKYYFKKIKNKTLYLLLIIYLFFLIMYYINLYMNELY